MKRCGKHLILTSLILFAGRALGAQTKPVSPITRTPVVFSGGHETDARDRGRPVVLIAAALGVPPEVFREAFRHVRPAPAGTEPDPQQVRDNKDALLLALGRYGVTNERLDTVSDYYRYVRRDNALWPTKPAIAYATVKRGVVTGYVVTDGGSGYSSPPTVTVPNIPGALGKARLAFGDVMEKNGVISAIAPGTVVRDHHSINRK